MLNPLGDIIGKLPVNGYPEITGMTFSKTSPDLLYITVDKECHQVLVNSEFLDKTQKDKRSQLDTYE